MNKETLKQMKAYYESEIITSVAQALNIKKEAIAVAWSMESTVVTIKFVGSNNVDRYQFTISDEKVNLRFNSYAMQVQDGIVNGIIACDTVVDLNVLITLISIIQTVLAKDYQEPVVEPEAAEPEAAE